MAEIKFLDKAGLTQVISHLQQDTDEKIAQAIEDVIFAGDSDENVDNLPYLDAEKLNGYTSDDFVKVADLGTTTVGLATADAEGNIISSTYAKNSDMNSGFVSLQSQIDNKVDKTTTVNGKALSSNIAITAADVGADAQGTAANALKEAKTYAEGQASSALTSAKTYTDTETTSTYSAAKTYAEEQAASALKSAKTYADTASATALSDAKDYNDTAYANANAYTDKKIADLINGAPTTLDTLGEIATAMNNNTDVVEALNEAIGKKANQTELDTHTGNNTIHVTNTEKSAWNKNTTDISNIISGTTPVGNANKLGGKSASEYVLGNGVTILTALPTGITNDSTMQELINAMPTYSMLNLARAMSPLTPESYCELTVIKSTTAYVIAFAKSQYTSNVYMGGVNTVNEWDGWHKYATTADLANYLPKSGGEVNGNLSVKKNSAESTISYVENNIRSVYQEIEASGKYNLYDKTNDKHIIESSVDGTNTFNGTATNATQLGGETATQWQTKIDNIQTTSRATLSTAGWYRVAEYRCSDDTDIYVKGANSNGCDITIRKQAGNSGGGYHKLSLLGANGGQQSFVLYESVSDVPQAVTAIRYTYEGDVGYIEIYYAHSVSNSVAVTISNAEDIYAATEYGWKAITPTLTSETLDGVTVTTTYDIPANASPVTDLDLRALTTTAGEALETSILAKAVEYAKLGGIRDYGFALSGDNYSGGDLPSSQYKYTSASVSVRYTGATVILWGIEVAGTVYPPVINYYNGSAWSGWKTLATTADLAEFGAFKKTATEVTGTDLLNNGLSNGLYYVYAAKNIPSGYDYGFYEVAKVNESYKEVSWRDSVSNTTYKNCCVDGTWKGWTQTATTADLAKINLGVISILESEVGTIPKTYGIPDMYTYIASISPQAPTDGVLLFGGYMWTLIGMTYGNYNYGYQIGFSANGQIKFRRVYDGVWENWTAITKESDLANYLPLSGGKIENGIIANGDNYTYFRVGTNDKTIDAEFLTSNGHFGIYDNVSKQWVLECAGENRAFNGTATGNLPLTGGRIDKADSVPLKLNNTNSVLSLLEFMGIGGRLGLLGFNGANNPIFYNTSGSELPLLHTGNSAKVATSGSYSDLTDKPTIPTNTNQLTNGAGFITGITKSMVTTALGYTPPTADTNTWRPLGTTADTACAGNDARLSNARPASDVYSWAKASSKPSYTKAEIGLGNVDNTADSAKSVNYANSSGYAGSAGGANFSNQLQAFTGDNFSGGNHYVKAIRGDGWTTRLVMCYDGGATQADAVCVNYSNSSGYANSAGTISNQGSAATKDIVHTTTDPGAGTASSYKEGSIICVYE